MLSETGLKILDFSAFIDMTGKKIVIIAHNLNPEKQFRNDNQTESTNEKSHKIFWTGIPWPHQIQYKCQRQDS